MNNVLIIGADSFIGSSLINYLIKIPEFNVLGTSRKLGSKYFYLDLTNDEKTWPKLDKLDSIVICAGITNIEQCQKNESLSEAINVIGLKKIISNYKSKKTKVIFFSTNHVFNGKKSFVQESDKTEPINIYGIHKALSEQIILENNGVILRLSKVIGPNFKLFEDWILRLKKGKKIIAYNNLHVSFVPLNSLVNTLSVVIKNECNGIIHLSGSENMAYDEIAKIFAYKLNVSNKLIISSRGVSDIPGVFDIKTSLKISKLITDHNIHLPNNKKIIDDFLVNKNL